MRAGAVAAAAGVNLETLRYYEGRGLLPTPDRSLGGHRIYPPETVTTLRVIKAAQRLGFTLDEISDLLTVGRHHHGTGRRPAGLQTLARDKLVEVDALAPAGEHAGGVREGPPVPSQDHRRHDRTLVPHRLLRPPSDSVRRWRPSPG